MMLRVSFLVALLLGSGYQTPVTPKEGFFARHPDLRKQYIQLDETSLALMEEAPNQKQHSIETLLAAIHKRATNECPSLVAGLEESLRLSRVFHGGDLERIAQLKRLFNEGTDHLFYYHQFDGKEHEWGWLILRDSEVLKKMPTTITVSP